MFNELRTKIKDKNVKVLLENFFSLSALQLVSMLLPLITLPYVLRVIGYENYGLIALAASLIGYFQSIVDYSFKITATRDVAVFINSPRKLNLIYSKVITVKILFLLISLLIITIIILAYPPFYEERLVFFYTASTLVGYILFPEWFFQGVEKMKYITIINVVVRIAFALSIFIFIKEESDYKIYPLMTSMGLLISGIVGQYILVSKYQIKFILLPIKTVRKTISENTPIFINQFMPNLYNNSTSFILGILATPSLLGIYSAIRKIVDMGVMLLNIVSRVFFPFLNKHKNAFKFYKKLMFSLGFAGIIVLIIMNKLIFWYLNIYDPLAIWVLILLAIGILGFVAYDVYGLNYFIVQRQDKLVMRNTIRTSIIGFLIAFPLIYYFDIIGAALSLLISRFLMGGVLMVKYLNLKSR